MTDKKTVNAFSKAQIVNSDKYSNVKDLLNACLSDSKTYTKADVDKIINSKLGGK